ncbi:MAG: DUF6580 family putative transport protein [Patescibacteria group bacterium]|nr:DUF6580 family putative transport protein [Patescibacteria group bacterium]
MKKKTIEILPYFLVILAVGLRILAFYKIINLPPNFAPIGAVALFSGVYLSRKYAILIPLAVLAISDYFIGFYNIGVLLTVWGSFALIGLFGLYLRKRKNIATIITGTLASSILFFLTTNFAVWAASGWYAKTWSGLGQSYFMALPFFRNTLLGDLFFVFVLFGSYELVLYLVRNKAYKRKLA